ncbi:MAG TPA: GGDEF domain-containing protein [Candidatus Limnocylindria bacterium]|jgi:diguanylate cyclase (GGDEF)-like protein|nr:GGDEF domain-containing protein [Candidatus Limnocylindria bacterium]
MAAREETLVKDRWSRVGEKAVLPSVPTRKGLAIFVAGAIAILAVSIADRLTREDLRFGFLYLLPIAAMAWWAGRKLALLGAALAGFLLVANDLAFGPQGSWTTLAFNEFTRITTFFAVGLLLSGLKRSREQLREESQRAFRIAITDELTGLYNRHFLREQLNLANSLAPRHGRPYSVLAFDIDGLKSINDTFGHAAGDAALVAFASELRKAVRAEDVAVRLGGDEFLVLLPETSAEEAALVGERLLEALHSESRDDRVRGVSAGVVGWTPGSGAEDLMRRADALVYESKRRGGGRLTRESGPARD